LTAIWQRGSAHRPEPRTRGSASWTGPESRSWWLTRSPQPPIARPGGSQARRGERARSPADHKRWQRRWAVGVTGHRTSSTARPEPADWPARLPTISAARRALSLTFCQLTVMAVPCLRSCSRIGGRPSRRASLMNLRLDTQVCRGGRPGGRRRTRRPAQVVVGRGGRKDLPGPGSMARTRCGHVCVIPPGPDEAAQ
jgi:hypothetical protein